MMPKLNDPKLAVAVLVIMAFAGCARVSTTLVEDAVSDAGVPVRTSLTTTVITLGTAKVKEAQPVAQYEFTEGVMSTGSVSKDIQSDATAMLMLVERFMEMLIESARASAAPVPVGGTP